MSNVPHVTCHMSPTSTDTVQELENGPRSGPYLLVLLMRGLTTVFLEVEIVYDKFIREFMIPCFRDIMAIVKQYMKQLVAFPVKGWISEWVGFQLMYRF